MIRPVRERTIGVAFTNVPTKIGAKAWRDCLRLMTLQGNDVIGMCEILTKAQKRVLMAEALDAGYGGYGWQGPNPVLWDTRAWWFAVGGHYKLHGVGPQHRRWPGYNAARYMTAVALNPRDGGIGVTALCAHFAPRGRKVRTWWRKHVHKVATVKLARKAYEQRDLGRIVVIMGDFNSATPPVIPGVHWVQSGVDMIGILLPAGVTLDEAKRIVFRAPTDHKHGLRTDVRIAINL